MDERTYIKQSNGASKKLVTVYLKSISNVIFLDILENESLEFFSQWLSIRLRLDKIQWKKSNWFWAVLIVLCLYAVLRYLTWQPSGPQQGTRPARYTCPETHPLNRSYLNTLHSRQPPYWLYDLCLEVTTVMRFKPKIINHHLPDDELMRYVFIPRTLILFWSIIYSSPKKI